ncbi:MAG: LPS assembly lipoprotein LptE [Pseudomonadota bacterium]
MKKNNATICNTLLDILLAGCLTLTLSACGFQLRGSSALPEEMSVTYIKFNKPYGTLMDDFTDALRAHHVTVTDNRDEATAVLTINNNRRDRDVLSVNTAGKVLEIQLRQSFRFSVMTIDKLPLVAPQHITMTRDYLYSSTDVLSKDREEAVVRRTLQQELVNLAMLRITAAAR